MIRIKNDGVDTSFLFDAYFWESIIFWEIKDYQKAIQKVENALEIDTKSYAAYVQWANILSSKKDYDLVIEKLEEAIKINNDYAPAYQNMTVHYQNKGNYILARNKLAKALEHYPKLIKKKNKQDATLQPFLYLNYGQTSLIFSEYSDTDFNKVENIYYQGLELGQNLPHIHVEIFIALVDLYIKKTEQNTIERASIYWSKARQFYYKAVDLLKEFLDDYETLGNLRKLGILYLKMEEIEEAEKYLKKALEKDIQSLETNQALGFLYSKKEDFSQAIKYYQRALKIDPDVLDTRSNLGQAYLKSEQLTKAEIEYKRVLKVTNYHVESHIGLGEVYLAMGDEGESDLYSQAIKHFDKAIKISNEREGSKVLNKKELSGTYYLRGYTRVKIYEKSVGIKDSYLLFEAQGDFAKCIDHDLENHKGITAHKKLEKQMEIKTIQSFTNVFGAGIIWFSSILILGITNLVFWQPFLSNNNKASVSQPSPTPTPIPNASPKSKDSTQAQIKVGENKNSEPTKINTTEYFLLTFSSLTFALISLYLPQLLKLKISGTGIELEKGSVDQAKIPTSLDIKR